MQADIQTFHCNLGLWEEELPHDGDPVDEEDEDEDQDRSVPIYPEAGAGAGYIPERVTVILNNFQEELNKVCVEFVRFKKAQGIDTQLAIARQSTLSFLQATEEELHLRNRIDEEQRALHPEINMSQQGAGDQDVEQVVNGENVVNRTNNLEEPIVEDLSILNGGG